jgi:membrane protein DedA with SNARE-associated domain
LHRYTVLTLLGSAIWCFALAGVGWALGSQWEEFHDYFKYVDYLIIASIAGAVAYLVWRLYRRGTAAGAR